MIIIGQIGPLWSPDLTREGQTAIMVLLAAVVMWATEAMPLPITSLVMVAMCGFLGIAAYNLSLIHIYRATAAFGATSASMAPCSQGRWR